MRLQEIHERGGVAGEQERVHLGVELVGVGQAGAPVGEAPVERQLGAVEQDREAVPLLVRHHAERHPAVAAAPHGQRVDLGVAARPHPVDPGRQARERRLVHPEHGLGRADVEVHARPGAPAMVPAGLGGDGGRPPGHEPAQVLGPGERLPVGLAGEEQVAARRPVDQRGAAPAGPGTGRAERARGHVHGRGVDRPHAGLVPRSRPSPAVERREHDVGLGHEGVVVGGGRPDLLVGVEVRVEPDGRARVERTLLGDGRAGRGAVRPGHPPSPAAWRRRTPATSWLRSTTSGGRVTRVPDRRPVAPRGRTPVGSPRSTPAWLR